MRVGATPEIKNYESRVAIKTPGVYETTRRSHDAHVQSGGGSGLSDSTSEAVGVTISATPAAPCEDTSLLLKIKDPVAAECPRLRLDQALSTYLHLVTHRPQTEALNDSCTNSIAYEPVQGGDRNLPLAVLMNEVAGSLD